MALTVLWIAAALAAAWVCLPMLLGLLGLARFTSHFTEDPAAAEQPANDPGYRAVFERLAELGLEPLGTRVEVGWFFAFHWYKSFHINMFATRGGDCFASVSPELAGDAWRVCFSTGLQGDALVQTANGMEQIRVQEADFVRWGYATTDLGELLTLHRELVGRIAADTGRAPVRLDLATFDALMARHTEQTVRKQVRPLSLLCLLLALAALGVPAFWLGQMAWMGPGSVPLGVLVGGMGYTALMPGIARKSFQAAKQEDEARQAARAGW